MKETIVHSNIKNYKRRKKSTGNKITVKRSTTTQRNYQANGSL